VLGVYTTHGGKYPGGSKCVHTHHYHNMATEHMDGEGEEPEATYDEVRLGQHVSTPLYERCQYLTLHATLELLNLQTMYGWSDTSVTGLLR